MRIPSLSAVIRAAVLGAAGLVIVAAGTPAGAQQEPSASAVAIAEEIISLKGAAAMYNPMVPGVIERAKLVLLRTNPVLGKDLNEVAARLHTEMAGRIRGLFTEVAKIYASRFTEQELKEVLVFYKSPVGQKTIGEEPAIFDASVDMLKSWQNKFGEEVMLRFREEMKKKGHDL